MASVNIDNIYRYVDKRASNAGIWTVDPGAAVLTNLSTVALMRTRLAAISGTIYTTDYLNHMTENDMRYAIRLNDDPLSGVNG